MKVIKWMLTLGILLPTYAFSQSGIERIKIDGFIGERINTCIEKRVKAQERARIDTSFPAYDRRRMVAI